MSNTFRDNSAALLRDLCPSLPADTLRLASHALLTLAEDSGTDALACVGRALPWFAARVDVENMPPDEVALRLMQRGALGSLGTATVVEHLRGTNDPATTLANLAQLDDSLTLLRRQSARDIRDTLLHDLELLAVALETIAESDTHLPEIRQAIGVRRPDPRALRVLQALELDPHAEVLAQTALSERPRRFEVSAADHLRQNGFWPAVRVALAFDTSDAETLHAFPTLRDDPPLEQLAHALIAVRGRTLAHLRGQAPLAALNPWVAYLRSGCNELAESRGITLREATSFAHFCLHLMNFCDLVCQAGPATHDDLRRSLMDIEDEVKEFALMGQTAGVDDRRASLAPFDATRWKRLGWTAYAAERVARLAGAWSQGTVPAPMGAPPRVAPDASFDARQAVDNADASRPASAHLLSTVLPHVVMLNAHWLERLDAAAITAALYIVLDAVAADVDSHDLVEVDFGPLQSWTDAPVRCQLLEHWLSHVVLKSASHATAALEITRHAKVYRVDFSPSPTLQAALTLLSAGVDSAHAPYLEALVRNMLRPDDDTDVRPTLLM